jgi:hypothetical protein
MSGTTLKIDGQLVAGVDEFGVDWRLTTFKGWSGSPASTLAPVQKSRAPGAWGGPRQLTPRVLDLGGLVEGATTDDTLAALDRLNAAVGLEDVLLEVTEGSLTRYLTACRSDVLDPIWETDTLADWLAVMIALDPRKYGDQIVASTGLPSSSGGLTWPVTWPVKWTGVAASGVISINNPGNAQAPVTVRIDGPCTAPKIRHDTSNSELIFASDYNLGAGSFLLIDMENRTVLEGGTASRNQWITTRGWFGLDPGRNDFIFSAATYNSTAQMTITTSPAYL